MDRSKTIVRTSIIGIIANVLLSAAKAAVGLISGSIAITLDAVNNLSDALSSGVTVVGAKLADRKPDKKHPYGHGRIEYVSAMIIAAIVLYAGVTSLTESVKKIFDPSEVNYEVISLAIIGGAVAVKIFLGLFFIKTAKAVGSDALSASGKDALFDAIISVTTLIAAMIYIISGGKISVEAYLGGIISALIIKAGAGMVAETISKIVGERTDGEKAKAIKETITSFEEVYGAYDLILHSYGPNTTIGSVHIEIPDYMTADKIDVLEHSISEKVYAEHKVIIAGISIYSKNTRGGETERIFELVRERVMAHEHVLQIHGFYLNEEKKTIHFDVIIDFASPDREGEFAAIKEEISGLFPEYRVSATLDSDMSD